MTDIDALERIAQANEKQARLVELRMQEGYTPREFGEPVARAFYRTARNIRDVLSKMRSNQ